MGERIDRKKAAAAIAGGVLLSGALVLPGCVPSKVPTTPGVPAVPSAETPQNPVTNNALNEPADLYGPAEPVKNPQKEENPPLLYGPATPTVRTMEPNEEITTLYGPAESTDSGKENAESEIV